jgi:carboxyl-terminal processing protease
LKFNFHLPLKRFTGFTSVVCATSALVSFSTHAQAPVKVVEYYNTTVAGYFLTGRASEQALLDAQPGFKRTGMTFDAVASTGAAAPFDSICRYAAAIDPAKFVSHFYGVTADCNLIESAKPANFFAEGFDFAVQKPNAGVCPASAPIAVYRSLRGISPVDVPVHRYTVSRASYDTMTRRGWSAEGPVFCVTAATDETPRPTFAPRASLQNLCQAPRVGVSPITGTTYPDRQGTTNDEKAFLRSFSDDTYLWYREIPELNAATFSTPIDYFAQLKTPAKTNSLKANGTARDKDEFHFSEPTESQEASSAGIEVDYGIEWSRVRSSPPRQWIVAIVAPGSPADLAGVRRGDQLISVNGNVFENTNNANALNAALFPSAVGQSNNFVFRALSGGADRTVALEAKQLTAQPVPVAGTIDTPTGRVGYLALTTFNTFVAEPALKDAFTQLATRNISDLVVDLRYNSGGFVYISSQLAYMVAGAARTTNKPFSIRKRNDKLGNFDFPFVDTTIDASTLVTPGQPLPTLNLPRVFVLTSGNSCSASETFISGLRGVDVEVILIGNTTCGKPYGFAAEPNCGTSYYTIQQNASNAKGQGDYINGFSARCIVGDDLANQLGDSREAQFATALRVRATGSCGAASPSALKLAADRDSEDTNLKVREHRSIGHQIAIDNVPFDRPLRLKAAPATQLRELQ